MTIRPARVEDAKRIAQIRARSWQAAYRGIVPDTILDSIDESRSAAFWETELARPQTPRDRTFVAERDGDVVGFASGGPTRDTDDDPKRVAELYTIYLLPEAWREGIGRGLLREVVAGLAEGGFAEATLWVLEGNARGRAFYEAMGWADDATRRTITLGAPLVELRYRMPLDAVRPPAWP